MWWWKILVGLPGGLYLLWKVFEWYMTGDETFWPRLGVPFVPSSESPSIWKGLATGQPFHALYSWYYKKFPEDRFVGIMEFRQPMLLITDPELVKTIMVRDFDHFVNRRTGKAFGEDLDDHLLFNMLDQKWRDARSSMTPAFTSGKMKRMFQHFEKSSRDLATYVETKNREAVDRIAEVGTGIDLQDVFGRFAMDVIGSTVFGIDSQALATESSKFYKMGLMLTQFTTIEKIVRGLKLLVFFTLPRLATAMKISIFPKDALQFFRNLSLSVLNARRSTYENNLTSDSKKRSNRNETIDFIDLMLQTQKRWQEDENAENEEDDFERDAKFQAKEDQNDRVLTDNQAIGNSLLFFIAGYDNTITALTLSAYHLAISPSIQERLRAEVEEVIADHDDRVTYEGVVKMTYLDMFVNEILRLYPPTTRMERVVTKPYKIPGTEIVLPVGITIVFPIMSFHQDPKHFPDPEIFNPEHFSLENKANRHPYAYMTFGHGPRSCIGMRFVVTQIKAAVAHLVHQFEIQPSPETKIPITVRETTGLYQPEAGVKLTFIKRDTS